MPLAKYIFPTWCVLASSMYSTKVDMLIRDIFIMTSAIIISTMDIQRVHTNNIAIMLIIQRFCSDPTSDDQVSVLQCHPWIGNVDTHST